MVKARKINIVPLPVGIYSISMKPSTREGNPANERQEWLGGRKSPSAGSIAQLPAEKEAFGGGKTRNTHLEQSREREMHRGLCG